MKHLLSVFALVVLFAFVAQAQQFETGHFNVNKETLTGYNLNIGSGDRVVNYEVKFNQPFVNKPDVVIAVRFVDAGAGAVRFSVEPSFITNEGFLVKLRTWSDSVIHGLGGTWLAISR